MNNEKKTPHLPKVSNPFNSFEYPDLFLNKCTSADIYP